MTDDLELVHGSGNVFRFFEYLLPWSLTISVFVIFECDNLADGRTIVRIRLNASHIKAEGGMAGQGSEIFSRG
jgi:hypothetical protein